MASPHSALSVSNTKRAVPILLIAFVFSLVVDNGFKTMTGPMAAGLGISDNTASLQASLAGVVIGIGAVVYAALADTFSIRKLMIVGIGLTALGSIMGYVGSSSWNTVLAARIIQTAGLAAAETLYVIYVTKYMSEKDQKTYLGFSTAAFQMGLLLGALTSGYISDNISWTAMFLVPLALLLVGPFIWKMVPEARGNGARLDALGLFFVTVFAASITLYLQEFQTRHLIFAILSITLFAIHVKKNPHAMVAPEFFTNKRYVSCITLVFIVYSTQLGFIFLLPYAASALHGMSQSAASELMIPGYICAVLVGVFSGKIGRIFNSRTTIFIALSMIVGSLAFAAILLNQGVWVLVVSIIAFASGFALLYAPLVKTALSRILPERSGIAIGFYNLTINIAIPIGIAYSAKMQDLRLSFLAPGSDESAMFSTVLWLLAAVVAFGFLFYFIADHSITAKERAEGLPAIA